MQNIPTFPQSRKFSLHDKDWYDAYYAQFQPYADFSFGNLVLWLDTHNDLTISQLNGNLIFTSTVLFLQGKKTYSLLGGSHSRTTLGAIFAEQKRSGEEQLLENIPNTVIDNLVGEMGNFVIEIDRPNFDYYCLTQHWAELEGSTFKRLRKEMGAFQRNYGERTRVEEIDLSDHVVRLTVRNSLQQWPRTFSTNDVRGDESKVINRLFDLWDDLPHKCIGIYIDDLLEGFLIYQPLPHATTAIINHVKVSYKYRDMFDYLLHRSAIILDSHNIFRINMEQDLGIEGIRNHKESLRPDGFLEKYTIRPRSVL